MLDFILLLYMKVVFRYCLMYHKENKWSVSGYEYPDIS